METLRCFLMCVCLVGVMAAPSVDEDTKAKRDYKGYRGQCFTSEGVFRHGELVATRRSPCLKYRCENGDLRLHDKQCPDISGRCHQLGTIWDDNDCHTYTCHESGHNDITMVRLRAGCTDAYGACRRTTETFPYAVEGQIYRRCSCTTTPQRIRYHCYPNTGNGKRSAETLTVETKL